MHIERIHKMLECLAEKSSCEIEKGIENVNTEEMGEVIDMIKDLDRKSTRLNSSHNRESRMPSSA